MPRSAATWPALLFRYSLFAASLGLAAPGGAFGQTPTNILMSVSGGISRGSYQAGVNWALLEAYKADRASYDIAGLSGASAGNINAVLTAIEWCLAGPARRPEDSLFWKIWVPTGWEQLFPDDVWGDGAPETMGVFTREFYDRHHFPLLRDWLDGGAYDEQEVTSGCRVPLGITLTRLNPDDVTVAAGISASNQRYAAALQLAAQGASLVFLPPVEAVREDASLGRIVFLPTGGAGAIEPSAVFDLVQASSAFPLAFEPVELEYIDPLTTAPCRSDDLPSCLDSSWFLDGGFFDNNPIDLAVGMHRAGRSEESQLVYINPGQTRGTLIDVAERDGGRDYVAGVSAIAGVLGGFVPSAREYELASFARSIDRDPTYFDRDSIRVTDRALPIVSDYLAGFAAFLGRPFREYDFMMGVYDGFHHLAREECLRSADPLDATIVAGRPVATLSCARREVGELLESGPHGLSDLHITLLRGFLDWEFTGDVESAFDDVPTTVEEDDTTALRYALITSVARGLAAAWDPREAESCADGDIVQRLICGGGLGVFLDYLREETREQLQQARALSEEGDPALCEDWTVSDVRGECLVDPTFTRLLARPEAFASRTIQDILHQLRKVEERLDVQGYPEYSLPTQAVEAVNQVVYGERYAGAWEFDINSSHIPSQMGHPYFQWVVPNYLSSGLATGGWEIGYRPTLHLMRSWALGFNVVPLRRKAEAPAGLVDRWALGAGLRYKSKWLLLPAAELGPDFTLTYPPSAGRRIVSLSGSLYGLAGLLRLNLRYVFGQDPTLEPGDHWVWSVGVADVNGVARAVLGRIF